ncbi:Methionyl-tRNA synthetase [Solidesulfovibrio carbinoliphilus subsp. oakridgensis]|uniref:Methionine--tRNA ligase n=1 Tax=Solidesulfovibrio carbinoliphilus subsp. oakridgensis TaxID=694327 RepID=G7Q6J7_9BACT|nr:methionine--tRNA ligase [Solidesulfovibrio carbinoliphilus]EHJ47610.1 Methionyl-tRNA synthetase [Solidesulfovibrio carbinoliphilus subsp. oakridgensis]
MNRFFITTPIYYVNAKPHLGHAYTTTVADSLARFHALLGEDVYFLTGTDEHGDKIAEAAKAAGQTPKEYADAISGLFSSLWPRLGITPSRFIRTTDADHKEAVRRALQQVYDKGDIYFGEYGGHYCKGCERFLTDKELVDGLCPDHKVKPEYIAEKNYFFRMSKYQGALLDHIRANPDFIRPRQYRNEVVSLLESGALEDLCISRPKSRLTWGIELPFDANFVTYVWFDALINYLTAIGWPDAPDFSQWWGAAEHLVAKDILKPHAIFWPTMLLAMDLPLYKRLNVHGYWLVRDTKMSKSLGNVVEPLDMAAKAGLSGMRYFFLREMVFGSDASYSDEAFIGRFNADLANDLGNLANRTLAMTAKYFGSVVPAATESDPADGELSRLALDATQNFVALFGAAQFSRALKALWELVRGLNKYVDAMAPWTLFKEGRTERLGTVMATALGGLRRAAACLLPVMPEAAEKLLAQLGQDPAAIRLDAEAAGFAPLAAGTAVAATSNLFPRLDLPAAEEKAPAAPKQKAKDKASKAPKAPAEKPGPAPEVAFEDFAKLDLRVGTVVSAAPVPGADRLYAVTVDIGEPEPRPVVAGLAEHFAADDLVGRQVVLVANLAPRKLRGATSHGMILAVKHAGGLALLTPTAPVAPGDRVS